MGAQSATVQHGSRDNCCNHSVSSIMNVIIGLCTSSLKMMMIILFC